MCYCETLLFVIPLPLRLQGLKVCCFFVCFFGHSNVMYIDFLCLKCKYVTSVDWLHANMNLCEWCIYECLFHVWIDHPSHCPLYWLSLYQQVNLRHCSRRRCHKIQWIFKRPFQNKSLILNQRHPQWKRRPQSLQPKSSAMGTLCYLQVQYLYSPSLHHSAFSVLWFVFDEFVGKQNFVLFTLTCHEFLF